MRAAKQQANELEHISGYLSGVVAPEGSPLKEKADSYTRESANPSKQLNGKLKSIRTDHLTRFADPPAPPPQQPLPEKPDSTKSSPINPAAISSLLKRTDTAKPGSGNSPTSPQNSQMLQLIEALSSAQKELTAQATKVKQLEDMLKEERTAREDAEERARRLEASSSSRPVTKVEEVEAPTEQSELRTPVPQDSSTTDVEETQLVDESDLQKKLDVMVSEMQRMKSEMDKFKRRADTAENDASKARESLAEMIERLRRENSKDVLESAEITSYETGSSARPNPNDDSEETARDTVKAPAIPNGHVRSPKLPAHLQNAVTTVLREGHAGNGEALANSAPYVSMLGVVLIGVGLMAYLNSWQKKET
jgi:hypothetical protein